MAAISYSNAVDQMSYPGDTAGLQFGPDSLGNTRYLVYGQDADEITVTVDAAFFIPYFDSPGKPSVSKLYIDGNLVADGRSYTWAIVDGATISWDDEYTCRITTGGGVLLCLT